MNVAPPPDPSVTATPCHRSTVRHSRLASSHRAVFGGPLFRPCGLRFAPCPRGSSRFAASAAHKLACGTPCFIGVFVPACASLARYSGAAERFALSSPPSPLRGFDGFGLFRAQRAAFVRPAYGGPVFRRFAPPSPLAARCSGAADAFWACPRASSRFAALACALCVLAPPAASRPPTASDRDGNAFLPTVRNRRSTSHAKRACGSCCSLGLLRPVSRTARGLRAHPQFAMVVLLRLTACSTPLLTGLTSACFAHSARPSCAPQKMPEMTYTPSFLIRASFFRDFVNTLEISLPFGPRGAIFPKWKKFLPKWQDALQRG